MGVSGSAPSPSKAYINICVFDDTRFYVMLDIQYLQRTIIEQTSQGGTGNTYNALLMKRVVAGFQWNMQL